VIERFACTRSQGRNYHPGGLHLIDRDRTHKRRSRRGRVSLNNEPTQPSDQEGAAGVVVRSGVGRTLLGCRSCEAIGLRGQTKGPIRSGKSIQSIRSTPAPLVFPIPFHLFAVGGRQRPDTILRKRGEATEREGKWLACLLVAEFLRTTLSRRRLPYYLQNPKPCCVQIDRYNQAVI
jgi:hypothetical protein